MIRSFFIFGLLILALVGVAWGVAFTFQELPKEGVAIVVAGMSFVISRIYESVKSNKERLYEKKRDVYRKLLDPYVKSLISMTKEESEREDVITDEVVAEAIVCAFDAVLYASDDVIKSYSQFRIDALKKGDTASIANNLANLLKAMRKDLGHTFTTLSNLDILQAFINFDENEADNMGVEK